MSLAGLHVHAALHESLLLHIFILIKRPLLSFHVRICGDCHAFYPLLSCYPVFFHVRICAECLPNFTGSLSSAMFNWSENLNLSPTHKHKFIQVLEEEEEEEDSISLMIPTRESVEPLILFHGMTWHGLLPWKCTSVLVSQCYPLIPFIVLLS